LINKNFNYSPGTLGVKLAYFGNNGVTNTNRKRKRQTRSVALVSSMLIEVFRITHSFSALGSCNDPVDESLQGEPLDIEFVINKCPETHCNTDACINKCTPTVKATIQSKLGSNPFPLTIETTNGTFTCLAEFCSFDSDFPGKMNRLGRISSILSIENEPSPNRFFLEGT
jgi:hypothetical protein